ncbi:MAG: hypothetical protein ACK4OF_02110 [Aquificaceae bacterium]
MEKEIMGLTALISPALSKVEVKCGTSDFLSLLLDIAGEFKGVEPEKRTNSDIPLHLTGLFIHLPIPIEVEREKLVQDCYTQDIYKSAKHSEVYTSDLDNNHHTKNLPINQEMASLNYKDLSHEDASKELFKYSSSLNSDVVVEESKIPEAFLTSFNNNHAKNSPINQEMASLNYKDLSHEDASNRLVDYDVKQGKSEEEEVIAFYSQLHKEEKVQPNNGATKTEAVEKQPLAKDYEAKRLNINTEEANLKLNFFGSRLKLYIDLKEDIYRPPTNYEVQRLVQSLQSLGFHLEVLKLNGSLLYSSDNRYGNKKEDRNKTFLSFTNDIHNREEGFNVYL